MIHIPNIRQIRIRQDGDKVYLIDQGRTILSMPWDAAIELSQAIYRQAKRAEEISNAEKIIFDHAILTRAGAPIGLSSNPMIKKEVAKEAAWNRYLRRMMPGGVKSREVFGTPTLIKHRPAIQ